MCAEANGEIVIALILDPAGQPIDDSDGSCLRNNI
jgi:hypothetical protein